MIPIFLISDQCLLWSARLFLTLLWEVQDLLALGITGCVLYLPHCSFVVTQGSLPPPWGCCPGQTLCIALPGAALWLVIISAPGFRPCVLGENSGAALGVSIKQLGCGTGHPSNNASLLVRNRAVHTEGGCDNGNLQKIP